LASNSDKRRERHPDDTRAPKPTAPERVRRADVTLIERTRSSGRRRGRMDRDCQLVNALSSRQPGAPEELLGTYGSRAYRLALRITRDAGDAEEVVQDAFCTVVRKIDTFRRQSAFSSWLYRIVANAAYNKLRQQPRRRLEVSLDDITPGHEDDDRDRACISGSSGDEDDPAVQNELRTVLQGAIHGLRPAWHAAFVLRDVDGLSIVEISEVLGLSVPSVKLRLHRARRSLRARLADYMPRSAKRSAFHHVA